MTEGTDTAVTLPLVRDLTFNEAHSALLGLAGVFVGVGFQAGFRAVAAAFTGGTRRMPRPLRSGRKPTLVETCHARW